MLTTVALVAALSSAISQTDGLTFANVRQTYFTLGPARSDTQLLPGDIYHLAFDIEGLKMEDTGKVQYAMGMEVTNAAGKVEFGQAPQDRDPVFNALGGAVVPALTYVELPATMPAGKYTVKVTVADKASNKKGELTRSFEVLPKDFGLVRVYTSMLSRDLLPSGTILLPGHMIYINFSAVGFARDATTKQPNIAVTMKVLDADGKPTLPKPFSGDATGPLQPQDMLVPMQFALHLNRPGKYTVELAAADKVANKNAKVTIPIVVLDPKSIQ